MIFFSFFLLLFFFLPSETTIPLPPPEELALMQKTTHDVVAKTLENPELNNKYRNMNSWQLTYFRKLTVEPYFTLLCQTVPAFSQGQVVQTLTYMDERTIRDLWYITHSRFSEKYGSFEHLETTD